MSTLPLQGVISEFEIIIAIRALALFWDLLLFVTREHEDICKDLLGIARKSKLDSSTEHAVSALSTLQLGIGYGISMIATAGTIVTSDPDTAILLLVSSFIFIVCVILGIPRLFRLMKTPMTNAYRGFIIVLAFLSAVYLVFFETSIETSLPLSVLAVALPSWWPWIIFLIVVIVSVIIGLLLWILKYKKKS